MGIVYVLQALNEISERADPVLYPEEDMTSGSLLRYLKSMNECICTYMSVSVPVFYMHLDANVI